MQTNKSQNALKKSSNLAATTSTQNRLFFKPYNTTSNGNQGNKRYKREHSEKEIQRPSVKKFTTENIDAPAKKDMKELSQNFSTHRKTLKLNSPRFTGNMESSKLKGDHSPNNQANNNGNKTSIVSGLSIISQLSFIKNSFSSPNIQGEQAKGNTHKSFE